MQAGGISCTQSVITEHISSAVNLAMVMLSETNAWKKIGGKRCWQASSTSPSTAQPYSHQLQVLRVFQSQPLSLQCLLFSVFFILPLFFVIFPPTFLLIFVYSLLLFSSSFLSIYFLPLSSLGSLFSECWIVNVSDPASWLNMFLDLYVRSTNCIATNISYKRNDNFY